MGGSASVLGGRGYGLIPFPGFEALKLFYSLLQVASLSSESPASHLILSSDSPFLICLPLGSSLPGFLVRSEDWESVLVLMGLPPVPKLDRS